ncbi:hypothetical protein PE066_03465 [Ramlibacter tataouinensis]|uniref:hypothetical protein n=1 Tax=Ramlibacter tataouinensis TaxID=94132 RepID=UPI0022F40430|nr:hypothetical protein [Ramlibacter tataouinensis]WBY02608.1 hypothetical protein PE066_03465 [Ramlibacter tataouinensis]
MPAARPPRPPAPAPFVAGTRATAPAALEESSDSAWQMFQELQRMHGQPVSPGRTAAEPAPSPAGAFAPTQPMQAPVPAPDGQARAPSPPVNLERVMLLARRNNRACPLPGPWAALHRLLPPRLADGQQRAAPAPLDGPAWAAASAMQKRLRLRDQIEWAERQGALQAAFEFLSGLREEEWVHFE